MFRVVCLSPVKGKAIALITIGGNDLLRGLIRDSGAGINTFALSLDTFVQQLPIRPVLLGNVYDPTLGDDQRNFLGIDAAQARKSLQRINTAIEEIALDSLTADNSCRKQGVSAN